MSIEDLIWAAGFFDGEGTVYVRHTLNHRGGNGKRYPLLTVECSLSQVRPEPVRRFFAAIGIGSIRGPYYPKKVTHSPYYRWQTAGRPGVCLVAKQLWPWLSAPKKEQFKKCWAELKAKRTIKSPALPALPK